MVVPPDHQTQIVSGRSTPPSVATPSRFPALTAILTSWLKPAKTAQWTVETPLWKAWLIHFLIGILSFGTILYLISIDERKSFFRILRELAREFATDFEKATLVSLVVMMSVELGFLVLAMAIFPWGAKDEPWGTSLAHALRRAWLHSGYLPLLILIIGLLIIELDRTQMRYWSSSHVQNYPSRPSLPPSVPPLSPDATGKQAREHAQATLKWKKEVDRLNAEYQLQVRLYHAACPMIVRWGPYVVGYGGFLGATWFFWSLCRAAGTRRTGPPIVRPPGCEFCGYNLTATPADSRCPECGERVADSIGPAVRNGTPWEHRHEKGYFYTWWRCGFDAVFQPKRFGRSLQVSTHVTDHRLFLVMHFPIIFMIAVVAVMVCYTYNTGNNPFVHDDGIVAFAVAPVAGYMTGLGLLGVATGAAGLVGMYYTLQHKRNLLPAAMQMSCYLGGYMVVWSIFAALLLFLMFVMFEKGVFQDWKRKLLIDDEILAFWFMVVPNLAWLFLYVDLVRRGVSSTCYANR